jgi:hypothetical protein
MDVDLLAWEVDEILLSDGGDRYTSVMVVNQDDFINRIRINPENMAMVSCEQRLFARTNRKTLRKVPGDRLACVVAVGMGGAGPAGLFVGTRWPGPGSTVRYSDALMSRPCGPEFERASSRPAPLGGQAGQGPKQECRNTAGPLLSI